MRIHRSQPDADFTIIPNATLRDERLSYLARGILAELLSNKDGWHETAETLAARAHTERGKIGEGRRKIREAFAELVAAGYLRHRVTRISRGRWSTELEIYDQALLTDIPPSGMSARRAETRIVAGGTDIPLTDGSADRPVGQRSPIQKTSTEDHKAENDQAENENQGVLISEVQVEGTPAEVRPSNLISDLTGTGTRARPVEPGFVFNTHTREGTALAEAAAADALTAWEREQAASPNGDRPPDVPTTETAIILDLWGRNVRGRGALARAAGCSEATVGKILHELGLDQ